MSHCTRGIHEVKDRQLIGAVTYFWPVYWLDMLDCLLSLQNMQVISIKRSLTILKCADVSLLK